MTKRPQLQHRNASWLKLTSTLMLQGAIFRAIRGLFDHGVRQAFQRLTGSWPGEEQPEQAEALKRQGNPWPKQPKRFPTSSSYSRDEFVQEQLRAAVSGARAAYLQTRTQRSQAVGDKRLHRNLRQAATGLQKATNALRPQKPEPKHRGRKLDRRAGHRSHRLHHHKAEKQYAQQAGSSDESNALFWDRAPS